MSAREVENPPSLDAAGAWAISRRTADEIVFAGGEAFAVYPPNARNHVFATAAAARRYADAHGVEHVLDWETGEYADA